MKRLLVVFSCLFVLFGNTGFTYAYNAAVNETVKTYEYENQETGEYFCWEGTPINARSNVVGTFKFKIRYSLAPDKNFFFKTDKVKVVINETYFANYEGAKKSCCNKHGFNVNVRKYGATNNIAYFKAPISSTTSKKLGSGFSLSPTPYRIEITNEDELPINTYLYGSGNISNY